MGFYLGITMGIRKGYTKVEIRVCGVEIRIKNWRLEILILNGCQVTG